MTRGLFFFLLVGLASAPSDVLMAADSASRPAASCGWPQWRGPRRDGISPEPIVTWPPVKLWQTNVGSGVSSAIAAGGRAYAMGHRQGHDTVSCLDGRTGKTIWQFSYPSKSDQTSDVRFPGPRSTPATDGKALYTVSLEGRVHCLDLASGKVLWSKAPRETGASDQQQYGVCCAPLLFEGRLICDVGSRCVALDKTTGDVLWQSDGGHGWNGAAPMIARFGGQARVVHGTGRCLDPATGRELWSVPYNEMSVATPIVADDKVFLAPFHGRNYGGKECALVHSDGGPPRVVWKNDEVQALCLSGVLWQGHLYVPDRDDLSLAGESGTKMNLKCIDFNTGEVKWTHRPLRWPSLIVAGGRLLIQTLDGELVLAEVSPQSYRELGRVEGVGGRCWTVPALADGILYCRNNKGELAAFLVGPRPPGMVAADPAAKPARPGGDNPAALPETADAAPSAATPLQSAKDWPRFRGAEGAGCSTGPEAPASWSVATGQNILWKTPIPLPGSSSPVVFGDRVFLTGADRKTGEVYCLDARTGKLRWRRILEGPSDGGQAVAKPWNSGSYAAPTPTTDGQYVWALFANGTLGCFDNEGNQVWTRSLGVPDNQYGHASSPVVHRDRLLLQVDQGSAEAGKSKILALDGRTGHTVWETARPTGSTWSTPIVVNTATGQQVVACGNPWVIGYEPREGTELWRAETLENGYYVVPSPIYARGLIFAVTEGAVLAAIRPGGKGDVTRSHVVWKVEDDLPNVCSPVSNGEQVFLLTAAGLLTCHNAADGKRLWQKDLAGPNRGFEASPVLAGGRIYVLSNTGEGFILPARNEEPTQIVTTYLGESCLGASPAIADGRLYVRTLKHLVCIAAPPSR